VVSARIRFVLNTLAAAALANNASFSPSTTSTPQRVVIFINVVGCGVDAPSRIRQNRCHEIESATSRHNGSKNTASSSSESTASNSAGSPNTASGRIASHNVG